MRIKNIIHYFIVSMALILAIAISLSGSVKAQKQAPQQQDKIEVQEIPQAVFKTDLAVVIIRSGSMGDCGSPDIICPANAFYMNNINVVVLNSQLDWPEGCADLSGGGVETNARLTVTYYEAKSNKKKTLTRTVHLGVNVCEDFTFKTGPICIMKSTSGGGIRSSGTGIGMGRGIRAEIQPIGKTQDPCQKNNVKILNRCEDMY